MSTINKKIDKIVYIILILIVAASIVKSFLIDPGQGKIPTGKIVEINSQWEKKGQEYCYVIPENSSQDLIFSMEKDWAAITVLLDGKIIYSCKDIHQELGAQREWIELSGDSSGKTLAFCIDGDEKLADRVMKNPMYIGEKNAVFLKSLHDGLYAFIFFFFTLILAFAILICRIAVQKKLSEKKIKEMRYLEFFIFDVGLWVLTDSQILQLFFERTAVIAIISFGAFLLMPVFFLLFLKQIMVYPWKSFDVFLKISMVNTILIMSVFLFRILPIYNLLFLQHLLILVMIPVILKNGITEIKRYKHNGMKKIIAGFGFLALCGGVSLGLFYVNASVDYAYFFSVGFLIFMICLASADFEDVYVYLERNAKTAVYREMAYVDSMTGLRNRASFERAMEQEKSAKGLTYIVFDNNNLKKTNDQYGHQAGDELLRDTAECIAETFDRFGKCFRIGGDEFVVILKGMSEKEVINNLECFERKIENVNQNRKIQIEVAYGYFRCSGVFMTPMEVFRKADDNMYLKKKEMR